MLNCRPGRPYKQLQLLLLLLLLLLLGRSLLTRALPPCTYQLMFRFHFNAAGLARQEELELLLVDHNQLSGVLPTYWEAPQLVRLDLQHNNFSGAPALLLLLLGLPCCCRACPAAGPACCWACFVGSCLGEPPPPPQAPFPTPWAPCPPWPSSKPATTRCPAPAAWWPSPRWVVNPWLLLTVPASLQGCCCGSVRHRQPRGLLPGGFLTPHHRLLLILRRAADADLHAGHAAPA